MLFTRIENWFIFWCSFVILFSISIHATWECYFTKISWNFRESFFTYMYDSLALTSSRHLLSQPISSKVKNGGIVRAKTSMTHCNFVLHVRKKTVNYVKSTANLKMIIHVPIWIDGFQIFFFFRRIWKFIYFSICAGCEWRGVYFHEVKIKWNEYLQSEINLNIKFIHKITQFLTFSICHVCNDRRRTFFH